MICLDVIGAAVAIAFLYGISATQARAEVVCYDESAFPAVAHLERREEGLHIVLGPKWWKGEWWRGDGVAPAMSYTKARGWVREAGAPIPRDSKSPACASLVPPIPLTFEEAVVLRPHVGEYGTKTIHQDIGACQQVGNVVWFGISFYDGEGSEGVGGVGRYDLETKKLEVRRLEELRDASINHLLYDGQSLYLATYSNGECSGNTPVSGLVQYDWNERSAWEEQGLCGFTYHGMALLDGDLWVASDLGLSRGRPDKDGLRGLRDWDNFIPNPVKPELVEPVTCEDLYARLLESLPLESPAGESPWSQFFHELAEHRPSLLGNFVLKQLKRTSVPSMEHPGSISEGNAPPPAKPKE